MANLENKVILVTGSTTGIGAAIAREAHQRGAYVMIHGRNEERAKALTDTLSERAAYTLADLLDPNTPQALIDATVKQFGRIDGVVNNAGIYPRSDIDSTDPELFDRVFTVNIKLPLFLIQAAVKQFRRQAKACYAVVNIGSINAYCGQNDLLAYSASKGALMTMTRNLGDAIGHERIRVNQLNVGWTVTETEHQTKLNEGLPIDWQSRVPHTYAPTGRLLRPEDIAPHVCFWLSDDSAPTTGQVYEVETYPVIGRNRIPDIVL